MFVFFAYFFYHKLVNKDLYIVTGALGFVSSRFAVGFSSPTLCRKRTTGD